MTNLCSAWPALTLLQTPISSLQSTASVAEPRKTRATTQVILSENRHGFETAFFNARHTGFGCRGGLAGLRTGKFAGQLRRKSGAFGATPDPSSRFEPHTLNSITYNGTTYTDFEPVHTYTASGTYTILG